MEVKYFNPKSLLPFVAAIIVYIVFLKTNGNILNYPRWYALTAYLIAGAGVVATHTGKIKDSYQRDPFQLLLRSFQLLLKTYVVSGVLMLTFNFLNTSQARGNAIEVTSCPINSFSRYETGNTIFYDLNGESYHTFGKVAALDSITGNEQLSNYQMLIYARPGWLGSLVLDRWEVHRK